MIRGVVGRTPNGCSLLLWFLLLEITTWHPVRTSRPQHRQGFVGGNHPWTNLPLESVVFVSTPWIAPMGGTIIEVKFTLQLQE